MRWKVDSRSELGVVVLSLRAPVDSVSPVSQLFVLCPVLKRKIFLFSKFLLFHYLKTVVMMMLMTSILLILRKGKGILHTIYVCLLYFVFGCFVLGFLFGFFRPQLSIFTSTIWV